VLAAPVLAQAGPVINSISGVTSTDAGVTNGLVDMSIGPAGNRQPDGCLGLPG
jgi:hypothetical protein